MSSDPFIVISAFSCAPGRGSEEEVGWRAVQNIVGHYRAIVVVDEGYRKHFLPEQLSELEASGVEFHWVALGGVPGKLLGAGKHRRKVYYYLWQWRLPFRLRNIIRGRSVAFAHHVTWAKYNVPCFLYKLGIPVIVGPVGGGEKAPVSLFGMLSAKDKILEWARRIVIGLARKEPLLKRSVAGSARYFVATRETAGEIEKICPGRNPVVRSQASIDLSELPPPGEHSGHRLISCGRLVGLKGFEMVIRSFYLSSDSVRELCIFGDGPQRAKLEALSAELARPGKKVVFHGWKAREDILLALAGGGIFCFASLHDSAGFAVLEALACGLPCVCLAAGGPAEMVDATCGVLVEPQEVGHTVQKMAEAITGIAEDVHRRASLSRGALERAKNYDVEIVKKATLEDYKEMMAQYANVKTIGVRT